MRIKVDKTIKKRVIHLVVETCDFTYDEDKVLDVLGEPIIKFEKEYGEGLGVAFEKKIRTGFKIKVKFDGTEDIIKADKACDKFLEELPELLSKQMEKLVEIYDNIEGQDENRGISYIDIDYK